MKIPSDAGDLQDFLRYVIDACMASQQDRRSLYEKRRRYYLYGQNADEKVRFNRLKAHMKLVSSFLFSPDGLVYNVTPPKNAGEHEVQQMLALQDDWNEDVHDSGLADVFADSVLWGNVFDTMVIKQGWNDITGQGFGQLVEPVCFGVFREDNPDFTSQPAMNHTFLLDYDEACLRLKMAGREEDISRIQIDGQRDSSALPTAVSNLVITATGGSNVQGNVMGQVNPAYAAQPTFLPKILAPMVRFHETWVWDDDAIDFRIFHSLDGPILLSDSAETIKIIKSIGKGSKYNSDTNWFLKKQNPFTPVTPHKLYNLFWGDAHIEDIIPLQDWSNQRLDQIDEILDKQVDPDRSFAGFQGLADEQAGAMSGPGADIWQSDIPGAKVEEFRPPMQEDLFKEFDHIGGLMMEASGMTEAVAGKSSSGARGGQQQKQMQVTGGGSIRKVAVGLEAPLVRMGDIGLRLKMKNDDTKIRMPSGEEFIAAQAPENFNMHVAGHSHSPLFTMETKELAAALFKAQAIDREWLIRLLNPPEKSNLLHSLRQRAAAEAKAKEAEAMNPQAHKGKK